MFSRPGRIFLLILQAQARRKPPELARKLLQLRGLQTALTALAPPLPLTTGQNTARFGVEGVRLSGQTGRHQVRGLGVSGPSHRPFFHKAARKPLQPPHQE